LHAHDGIGRDLEGTREPDRRVYVDRFAAGEHIGKSPLIEADGLGEFRNVDIERVEILAFEARTGVRRRSAAIGRDVDGSDGGPPDLSAVSAKRAAG
jgi:hypothetical protein